jgi:hypothetical protein
MQWGFNPVAGVNDFAGDRASLEFLSIPREQTKAFAHCARLDEFESSEYQRAPINVLTAEGQLEA